MILIIVIESNIIYDNNTEDNNDNEKIQKIETEAHTGGYFKRS